MRVKTFAAGEDDVMVRVNAAEDLAFTLFSETDEHSVQIRDTFRASDPTAAWESTAIDVGGTRTEFKMLSIRSSWVALGGGPGCLISIEARHLDSGQVHLVVIEDREQYLADDGATR